MWKRVSMLMLLGSLGPVRGIRCLCLFQLKLLSQDASFIAVDVVRSRVNHHIDLISCTRALNVTSSILGISSLVLDARATSICQHVEIELSSNTVIHSYIKYGSILSIPERRTIRVVKRTLAVLVVAWFIL